MAPGQGFEPWRANAQWISSPPPSQARLPRHPQSPILTISKLDSRPKATSRSCSTRRLTLANLCLASVHTCLRMVKFTWILSSPSTPSADSSPLSPYVFMQTYTYHQQQLMNFTVKYPHTVRVTNPLCIGIYQKFYSKQQNKSCYI